MALQNIENLLLGDFISVYVEKQLLRFKKRKWGKKSSYFSVPNAVNNSASQVGLFVSKPWLLYGAHAVLQLKLSSPSF